MGFSFFGVHHWGSVQVRGVQVAERMGAKFNPTEGFEDDICIFTASRPKIPMPPRTFLDPGEKRLQLRWIAVHPTRPVIAWSLSQLQRLQYRFTRNFFLIPQHHCNFENELRPDRPVVNVGVVGSIGSLNLPLDDLRDRLERAGLKFVVGWNPRNRAETVVQYQRLDIQICFRDWLYGLEYRSPLKIANAGSFGIPTVSFPEQAFAMEADGMFLPATTLDELVEGAVTLAKDPALYRHYAEKARCFAADYHIDEIVKKYRALEEVSV